MVFFILNKFKHLFFLLYNNIGCIKDGLYCSFVIGLLLGPARGIFAFLASQLALPWLVFILAILLIVISSLLRAGLENKSPAISLRAFSISLFIILFLWLMHSLNFIEGDSALYGSCLTALADWEEISSKMENFFTPSVNNVQVATAGGADSKEIEWEKGLKKLIPSSMAMEEEGSGSRKRLNPDTDSELVGPSKKAKVTISLPYSADSNVPIDLYRHSPSVVERYPAGKLYRGVAGFNLAVDSKGFEYIPCPTVEGAHQIGSSGFISYKPGQEIDKVTVLDPEEMISKGWCSDGTRSNQPAAGRLADLLLAAKANGQIGLSNTVFDEAYISQFVSDARGKYVKMPTISYTLILALRLSK